MRTAVIVGGVVVTVVILPDGSIISADQTSASAPATYLVEPFGGAPQTVDYTAISTAPDGGVFVQTDTASIGDSWTSSGFVSAVAPPPSKDELIQYATTKQLSVVVSGITLTGTATPAALAAVTASINAGSVTTFAQVDTALTPSS